MKLNLPFNKKKYVYTYHKQENKGKFLPSFE